MKVTFYFASALTLSSGVSLAAPVAIETRHVPELPLIGAAKDSPRMIPREDVSAPLNLIPSLDDVLGSAFKKRQDRAGVDGTVHHGPVLADVPSSAFKKRQDRAGENFVDGSPSLNDVVGSAFKKRQDRADDGVLATDFTDTN